MKSQTFQQSLLQEILDLDENSLPFFTQSDLSSQHIKTQKCSDTITQAEPPQPMDLPISTPKNGKTCTNSEFDNQQSRYQTKNKDDGKTRIFTKSFKRKAQISQEKQVLNYSTIYTHRSNQVQNLYDKALIEKNVRNLWISQRKKEKQQLELKFCSYKPVLNQTSIQIMNKANKQQLLEKRKNKKQKSFKKIIEESEQKKMKGCCFTPNIGKKKQKRRKQIKIQNSICSSDFAIKNNDKNDHTIFDQLYKDFKIRQSKNKQLQTKYYQNLFKYPIIDQISKEITKDTNFYDRKLKDEKRRLQKQLERKQKQNIQKMMHRPSINYSFSTHRNNDIPIGEYLYLIGKRNKNETNTIQGKICDESRIQTNKKSKQVYEERKIQVFKQIFNMLDEDGNGIISINSVSLSALPHKIVKIISPLIEELELMEVELNEQQFFQSLSNLFKTLSIHEKDVLLGFVGHDSKQKELPFFRPKINAKSKFITNCNQRSQMSIYDYCFIKETQREKQLQTERVEKTKRELEKCTFKPKILSRRC